jgi:hypothetical protein
MILRQLAIGLIILLISTISQAQGTSEANADARQVVGITKLTSTGNEAAERFLPLVTERLIDVVEGTNRFRLVDLTSESARRLAIESAKDNYKADNAFNVSDNASLVAEYTLTADVGSLRFIKQKEKGNDVYKADLVMTLKLIDTSTGVNSFSETFTSARSLSAISPERAVSNAFDTIQETIRSSVLANFPIVTSIAKVREESGGKVVTLIVFGGSSMDLQIGQKFDVITLDNSLSPPLEEKIGTVTITQNLDARYSNGKVDSGGDKIQAAMSSNQTVKLRSQSAPKTSKK